MNNIPKDQLSYYQYLSPELTQIGWKPIYIHSYSARMPIEQMDYLLEKYWFPHITNPKQLFKQQTVDNIDKLIKPAVKQDTNNLRRLGLKQPKTPQLQRAPSTTSSNEISYPIKWKMPCFPLKIHDQTCIFNHMKYWTKGVMSVKSKPLISNKYVTFLKDCGGFNNIRQGFEFHVMVAWVTGRTLVLPPDEKWYLIDFGPVTRGKDAKNQNNFLSWPGNRKRRQGVSNYDIWFDLNDMSLVVPVITTSEFIRRESSNLNIPDDFQHSNGFIVDDDENVKNDYVVWLNEKATKLNVNLPWGQLANLLYWPSINDVEKYNSEMVDDAFIDHRKKREYNARLKKTKFIHFPSCARDMSGEDRDYRYLGQIARSIAFSNKKLDRKYKQILRDHIHLRSEIMEYASLVVGILGAFKYSSFHIRRNELQYHYVFASAQQSYDNVKQLLGGNEVLYIATDENEIDFFNIFEDNGRRKVYRWKDFFGDEAKFSQTKNIIPPGKFHGEIEMVICAMGRLFFGTKESTFSSYIGRLRGYFNAPYTQTLYHHYKLTNDIDESSQISKDNPDKPYRGQIYKIPFPDLWEDIQ